jgi:hypothetical protein
MPSEKIPYHIGRKILKHSTPLKALRGEYSMQCMSTIHPKEGGIEVFAGYLLLAKRTVQGDQTRNNSSGLYYKNILTIVSDDGK